VNWDICTVDNCYGARLNLAPLCIAHLAEYEPQTFQAQLRQIGDDGLILQPHLS
jgi:hypothetical protein